jgi:hypothetical protein
MGQDQKPLTRDEIKEALVATVAMCRIIIDTVASVHPEPAPSGPMYAAVMPVMNIGSYTSMMRRLCEIGMLKYVGNHCYMIGDEEAKRRGLVTNPAEYRRAKEFADDF